MLLGWNRVDSIDSCFDSCLNLCALQFTWVSEMFLQCLGYSVPDVTRLNSWSMVHPDDAEKHAEPVYVNRLFKNLIKLVFGRRGEARRAGVR